MNKLVLGITGMALVTASAVWAYPNGGKHRGGEHHQQRMEKMLEEVNATPDQRAAIIGALQAQKPAREALHSQKRALHKSFSQLDPTGPNYLQQVDAMANQYGALSADEFRTKALARQQVAAHLTDDQRAKLKDLRQQRRAGMKQKRLERKQAGNRSVAPQ